MPEAGRLVISWEAADNQRLADRPIRLSYAETAAGPWNVIVQGLDNSGRYAWPVDDRLPPRVYLRLEVCDAAGNIAVAETPQPVAVERPQPSPTSATCGPSASSGRNGDGEFCYTDGMAKALHAIDYLAQPDKYPPQPVCVVFGDELFLRRQAILQLREAVLGGGEGDFSLTAFEGTPAELRDVLEELATVAMFGGRRLVVVEEADDFVSRYRAELEDYVARPSRTGVLVLDVDSLAEQHAAVQGGRGRRAGDRLHRARPAAAGPLARRLGQADPRRAVARSPWRTCSSR